MAWYTSTENCINPLPRSARWLDQIVSGQNLVDQEIGRQLIADVDRLERPRFFALDGYKGALLAPFLDGLGKILAAAGIDLLSFNINAAFRSKAEIEDDTRDMFHCLALTLGQKARVYSKRDPSNEFILEDCDNIVLPACFGEYVCENLGTVQCEIIKTLLITERRDHIDKKQEEKDWVVE
jgi:hypothetical protein